MSAVLGTLERLHLLGLYPDTLVGHSLGGAVLALVQQRLKDEGTTLRIAHRVRSVVLLGSAILNPIPDPTWDAGVALALLLPFSQETAERGVHFAVPVPFWWYVMFSTRATPPEVSPNAPSPQEVIARGYFAVDGSPVTYEPRAILDDLAVRPTVDAGLFDGSSGTALTMVVYEQDLAVDVNLSRAYYAHLTGSESAHGFVIVRGRYTAHDTHISDPALLLAATPWLLTAF